MEGYFYLHRLPLYYLKLRIYKKESEHNEWGKWIHALK